MTAAPAMAVVLYASLATFVIGLGWRLCTWWRAPVPANAVLMPAPRTRAGVLRRVLAEVFTFRSLLRASRWTWALGLALHLALALAFAGHLRFVLLPANIAWPDLHWLAPLVGVVMLLALAGLALRRLVVDRLRYLSTPADFLWLVLLGAIALSGLWLGAQEAAVTDGLRDYVLALCTFRVATLPGHPAVSAHLLLASALLVAFPFGKLLHGPGVVLMPTRLGRDRDRPQDRNR